MLPSQVNPVALCWSHARKCEFVLLPLSRGILETTVEELSICCSLSACAMARSTKWPLKAAAKNNAGTSFSLTKAFWFHFLFCCCWLVFLGGCLFFLFVLLPLGYVIWKIEASWKMEDENQDPHIFQPCIGQFCINMDLLAAYTTKGSLLRFLYCHGVEIRGGVTTGQPACTDSWCYGLCIVHHVPRSPHGRFHSVTVSAFPRSVSVFTLNPRDRALSNAKVTC